MKRRSAVVAALLAASMSGALAGCGGEDADVDADADATVDAEAGADAGLDVDSDVDADVDAGTEEVPQPGSVLLGRVGTPEDPEAFVITFTTEDGTPVRTLEAGEYTIEVTDPANEHNFHLTGPSVDETTSVPETEEVTWEVTFEEGEYTYQCDPHPAMTGSFAVT